MEVLREGYRILFSRRPPLSDQLLPMPSYTPSSIRGKALEQEFQDLLRKQAIEQAPQTPGFYSRLFVVQKDSGAWRPIIDLSTLNTYVASRRFHMETPQSVLRSIRPGDWMISLDLQDAYLQVPIHPESHRYLRFTMGGVSYQFRVLCFGLTTAPQVFTRLMAPISAILHRYGIRMLRYLDDWLILAESRTACIQVRDRLLQVCEELGLQVNFKKSSLIPSQDMTYLGMQIQSVRFVAKPTETRVENLLKIIEEFLSSPDPPAALWCRLLGHLSSLTLLVKGGMLRMQSLQIRLRSRWDFRDELLRIPWDPLCQEDLLWWSWAIQKREGVDLSLPVPDLSFYSDASDVGWGAIVGEHQVSGVWTPSQRELSINLREMMAVQKGLLRVQLSSQRQDDRSLLRQCHDSRLPQAVGRHEVSGPVPQSERDSPVGRIHGDHATSPVYPGVSQHESGSSQSAQPGDRIGMDATPGGSPRSSPPVAGDHRPVRDLADSKAPSVLCSSVGTQSSGDRCIPPALGQPSGICLSSHSHHKESSSQTESLSQLRSDSDRPLLASKGMVSRSTGTSIRHSNRTTQTSRSAATTAFPSVSRKSPYASCDCVATLKQFASQAGFSETVAGQLALCRRKSTRLNYQVRWGKFRKWCRDFHHRSSEPTIPKIAEFLTFLFKTEKAAVSTI